MGRSLEVAEGVRSLTPELARALSSVRLASRKREREAVFSFRYSVYIDALEGGVGTVDNRRRRLHDPEDDEPNTLLVFTGDGRGEISGTARLRHWAPGEVPEDVRARYSLDRFEGMARLTVAEVGRVMLAPRCRGSLGLRALFGGVCALAVSRLDVDVVFLTCLSGLVDRYRRIGFRSYAAPLVPTVDGLTVPLVLILSDRPHLERVGSFLLPLTDASYGTGKRPPFTPEIGRRCSTARPGRFTMTPGSSGSACAAARSMPIPEGHSCALWVPRHCTSWSSTVS